MVEVLLQVLRNPPRVPGGTRSGEDSEVGVKNGGTAGVTHGDTWKFGVDLRIHDLRPREGLKEMP